MTKRTQTNPADMTRTHSEWQHQTGKPWNISAATQSVQRTVLGLDSTVRQTKRHRGSEKAEKEE